jgi:hypothetical protein
MTGGLEIKEVVVKKHLWFWSYRWAPQRVFPHRHLNPGSLTRFL